MKLVIREVIDREICHFATSDTMITSSYNTIYIGRDGKLTVQLPKDGWRSVFGLSRLSRRALRLDKCNVVPVEDGLVAIRQGKVFHYDQAANQLRQVLRLANCRNVLHQSIAVVDRKVLYFGEYGTNRDRSPVSVYRSSNGGRNWETVFVFPAGRTKHVHGCYYDPFEERIWTFTGDFDNECHILCSTMDFGEIEWIGDGSQTYRACGAFFEEDSVHWIMDSPLQNSYHVRLDRRTRAITRRQLFPGPVWYVKHLADGYYLAATSQEIGPGVLDRYVHLMISRDLYHWEDIYQFQHDGYPKQFFKFGVIGFPDGIQFSHSFYIFAEAVKGLDGKTALCGIG